MQTVIPNSYRYRSFVLVLALLAGLSACKTTQTTREGAVGETAEDSAYTAATESDFNFAAYRNSLSDLYATQNHEMPDFFMESSPDAESGNRDPFDGFRIQVVTTRNVSHADSVARSFRMWSDTTIVGFKPETYVFFKQPYYKVHVGDFNERHRAIEFSRLVKRKYPDAWVVHDRINPYMVPADTTEIRFKPASDSSKEPNQ
ncbi:SPOR domain-containing protein [Halalkalibaculum sp. DA384]|uniref:SPOR domain-containing protein n=1 Tax=Halalkalibaculum sp. DA384 TaxID=3373606 RepID=UPI003754F283